MREQPLLVPSFCCLTPAALKPGKQQTDKLTKWAFVGVSMLILQPYPTHPPVLPLDSLFSGTLLGFHSSDVAPLQRAGRRGGNSRIQRHFSLRGRETTTGLVPPGRCILVLEVSGPVWWAMRCCGSITSAAGQDAHGALQSWSTARISSPRQSHRSWEPYLWIS